MENLYGLYLSFFGFDETLSKTVLQYKCCKTMPMANFLLTIYNKRPMGHIAHLSKQFKSINTYDYIITLIKRRKRPIINLLRIYWLFIWANLNPLPKRMFCAKSGWNLSSGSVEDFKFRQCILLIRYYRISPLVLFTFN